MTKFADFFNKVVDDLKIRYSSGMRIYPHLIIVKNEKHLWFDLHKAPSYMSPMDAVYPLVTGLNADMFVMFSEIWMKMIDTKEEMLGSKNLRYGDISRFSDRVEGFVMHGAALTGERADELFYIITENGKVKGLDQEKKRPTNISSSKIPHAINGRWIEYESRPGHDFDGMAKRMEK